MRGARAWGLCLLLAGCGGGDGEAIDFTLVVEFWDFGPERVPVVGAEVCLDQPSGACATTDAAGVAIVRVPPDRDVLLRIAHPELFPTLMPLRVSSGDEGRVGYVAPYPPNIVAAVAATLGQTPDPAQGHLTFGVDSFAPDNAGRTVALIDPSTGEPAAEPFYLDESNFPSPTATTTAGSGNGGFANAPPGEWLLDSDFGSYCRVVRGWEAETADGRPALRAPIRAGHITIVLWADCAYP